MRLSLLPALLVFFGVFLLAFILRAPSCHHIHVPAVNGPVYLRLCYRPGPPSLMIASHGLVLGEDFQKSLFIAKQLAESYCGIPSGEYILEVEASGPVKGTSGGLPMFMLFCSFSRDFSGSTATGVLAEDGRVLPVLDIDDKIAQARALGYARIYVPVQSHGNPGIDVVEVYSVEDLLRKG